MISKILIVSVFVVFGSAQDITLKAPSLAVNCGCQCSNYIFRDGNGRTQGNCNSADRTGAKWCYVEPGHTCQDTRQSGRRDRFGRFRQISNEACATPRCGGSFLGGFGNNNNGFGNNNNGFGNNNNGFGNNNNGFGSNNNGFGNNGFGSNNNNGLGNNGFGSNNNNGFRRPSSGGLSINNILRPRTNKKSNSNVVL